MENVQVLADALRLAERAHAQHEVAGGEDEWPMFYAQWLMDNVHIWLKHSLTCDGDNCGIDHD